jgi:hypothetical protein
LIGKVASCAIRDIFSSKARDAVKDAAILISRAKGTYREYQDSWAPHLEAIEHYPAPEIASIIDFELEHNWYSGHLGLKSGRQIRRIVRMWPRFRVPLMRMRLRSDGRPWPF